MAWMELHEDLLDHYKMERLADLVGLPKVYASGHVVSLWLFTLRNAWRDANLEKWGDAAIERAAGWQNEPGKLIKALREVGFLDGYIVHGWIERAGTLVWKRIERERENSNSKRGRRLASKRATKNPVRPTTLPYPTVPDQTKQITPSALGSEVPEIVKPLTPLQRVVGAYKIAKGNDRDDKAWDKANFGRYSKAAKSLIDCFGGDEKAAVVYLLGRGQDLDDNGLDWTLETIARHAWDNKSKLTEVTDGSEHGKVGSDNLLGARRSSRATPAGELAGGVLRELEEKREAPPQLEGREFYRADGGEE